MQEMQVLGRSPGGGNGNPLYYSCLGNPMDRGALWAAVHGVAKNWAHLNARAHTHTHTHTHNNSYAKVAYLEWHVLIPFRFVEF